MPTHQPVPPPIVNITPTVSSSSSSTSSNNQAFQVLTQIDAVKQTLVNSHFATLGTSPTEAAALLAACSAYPTQYQRLASLLKRFVYETITAASKQQGAAGAGAGQQQQRDIKETVLWLDTLYPLIMVLPPIDSADQSESWKYHPHAAPLKATQKVDLRQALFDEEIGRVIADKFEAAFPFKDSSMAVQSPSSPSGSVISAIPVATLVSKLDLLLNDLQIVSAATDHAQIKQHYLEHYHAYFLSQLRFHCEPSSMAISECLLLVKWLYKYTSLIDKMLPSSDPASPHNNSNPLVREMFTSCDRWIDTVMDQHDEQSKTKIIVWVSNILKNEEKNAAERDDDGFYHTTGPQDLFMNINSLYDHAVTQQLGSKALFRIVIMYLHVLLYYQECLQIFLAQLEVAEQSGNRALQKPLSFLFAQINNSNLYHYDTTEWEDHVLDTVQDLPEEQLNDIDDVFLDVLAGFDDVATAAVQVLTQRILRPLVASLQQLFSLQHLSTASFLSNQILDPLSDSMDDCRAALQGEEFTERLIQQTCASMLNLYIRALIGHLQNSGQRGKLTEIFLRIQQDRAAVVNFYHQYTKAIPAESSSMATRGRLLDAMQQLGTLAPLRTAAATPVIEEIKALCEHDAVVTAYTVVSAVLEARGEGEGKERRAILSQFPEDAQRQNWLHLNRSNTTVSGRASTETGFLHNVANYHLEVTIVSGKNLVAKDKNSSDPYVILSLLGQAADKHEQPVLTSRKTRYINHELNPVWNATFNDFSTREVAAAKALLFEVWDSDVIGSDFMGQATLTLEQIRTQKLINIDLNSLSGSSTSSSAASNTAHPPMSHTAAGSASTLPAAFSSSKMEMFEHQPAVFTLPLTQKAGVENTGNNTVSGSITVSILYYAKSVPHAAKSTNAATLPAAMNRQSMNTSAPSASSAQNQPQDYQPANAHATPPHTQPVTAHAQPTRAGPAAKAAPPPPPAAVAPHPSMMSESPSEILAKLDVSPTEDPRSLFDRVITRHKKKLTVQERESAQVVEERQRAAQREADLEARAAIDMKAARAGMVSVARKLQKAAWRPWSRKKTLKQQRRIQRLEEDKEIKKRMEELNKRRSTDPKPEKKEECSIM